MKSVLVTGAGGFVAGSVIAQAPENCKVHAVSGKEPLAKKENLVWHRLDLLDPQALKEVFRQANPDTVVHSAAVANIDFCEKNQEIAERFNVGVTRTLVDLCDEHGAKPVYLSTDTVFDGEKAPYKEEDSPLPINFYGVTKARGEEAVRSGSSEWVIARLSLVVGLPFIGTGNSFLPKMLSSLRSGEPVYVPGDEIRTPVDVVTLGRALLELALGTETGCFHLSGNDSLPRLEMARRIARRCGYSEDKVLRKDSGDIPGRAPRPRDVSLNNSKARELLSTRMLGLEEALDLIRETSSDHSSA